MKRQTPSSGRGGDHVAAALQNVSSSAGRVRRARDAYRAALVAAVSMLEADGSGDAFAQVAKAAGVSRQAVKQLVDRYRDAS